MSAVPGISPTTTRTTTPRMRQTRPKTYNAHNTAVSIVRRTHTLSPGEPADKPEDKPPESSRLRETLPSRNFREGSRGGIEPAGTPAGTASKRLPRRWRSTCEAGGGSSLKFGGGGGGMIKCKVCCDVDAAGDAFFDIVFLVQP